MPCTALSAEGAFDSRAAELVGCSVRACSHRPCREGQGPWVNMGQGPIPQIFAFEKCKSCGFLRMDGGTAKTESVRQSLSAHCAQHLPFCFSKRVGAEAPVFQKALRPSPPACQGRCPCQDAPGKHGFCSILLYTIIGKFESFFLFYIYGYSPRFPNSHTAFSLLRRAIRYPNGRTAKPFSSARVAAPDWWDSKTCQSRTRRRQSFCQRAHALPFPAHRPRFLPALSYY